MTTSTAQQPVTQESDTDKFAARTTAIMTAKITAWVAPVLGSLLCLAVGALWNHAWGMEKRMSVQETIQSSTAEAIRQLGERMDRRMDKLEDKIDAARKVP